MKLKTAELSGAALDWAVAKCEGLECDDDHKPIWFDAEKPIDSERITYHPSTDWSQGGRIIEQNLIGIQNRASGWSAIMGSVFHDRSHPDEVHGPTPLTAAMRCYVASKLGDEVEVPDELCQNIPASPAGL